ncbi:hypothetical protein [Streptomyces sp. NPDC057199]|uniref:hypothetical protein n=1 Tax=Streptomyces sp. NPDC057199 TaxID=3346047 RepID=UPI0036294817
MNAPARAAARGRPGPSLGRISDATGPEHRAWLLPLRTSFLDSKWSCEELADKSYTTKGKVSELLRGVGDYPRWDRVRCVHQALNPLQLLEWYEARWEEGALAAGRKPEWINKCLAAGQPSAELPPSPVRPRRRPLRTALVVAASLAAMASSLLGLAAVRPGPTQADHPPVEACASPAALYCELAGPSAPARISGPAPDRRDVSFVAPSLRADAERAYVNYPRPFSTATGSVEKVVLGTADARVYTPKGWSKRLWIRGGATVYVICTDSRDFLVLYGGDGDRVHGTDTQFTRPVPQKNCPPSLDE